MKIKIFLALFSICMLFVFLVPVSDVGAQAGCVDAAGGPIPCPTAVKRTPRPTSTLPPTFTATSTATFTSTPTSTSTATSTASATATVTLTSTTTSTVTPTFTPTPPSVASAVLPGAGIGLFILLLILGIFLPLGQKIRVTKRGY